MPAPVIFFDGICNLCTGAVQFVIRRDPQHYFRFASLQSESGQQMLAAHQLPQDAYASLLLLENGKLYTGSTAALRICRKLSGIWRVGYGFIVIPPVIRDAVYNYIARNRYKWFGKKEECWIPTPELQSLFVDP